MKHAGIRHVFLALCAGFVLPALASADLARAGVDSVAGRVRVVPNPWCASKLSQQYNPGRKLNTVDDVKSGYSRMMFFNLPAPCTINIYTVDGDLIRTIDHPATGGSSTPWDLITNSDQYAVTGIYVWVVESSVGRDVGKLIIIR